MLHIDLCIEFREGEAPTPEELARRTKEYYDGLGGEPAVGTFNAQVTPRDAGDEFVAALGELIGVPL